MFSENYCNEIRQYFDRQMELLKDRESALGQKEADLSEDQKGLWGFSRRLLEQKRHEIEAVLAECTEDEAEALQFLYSAMPLSDLLDYPAQRYLAYARHGVFLWQEGPFAGKVPEKIFANYVLHHRVHNEDIADTRAFFYERLKDRIAGKSMYDAAVEANMWCGEKATYRSSFMRTQNPVTMYKTAAGRCGEEAPFASTALRSIGIPAREVAAPWWAHCDDNHAWVEAWCDGKWHFLGGCEPEEVLDKGWFRGPTARAMLIDSRWFGKDEPLEPVSGRPDMSVKLNHLSLYADTVEVRVKVEDEAGNPVPGARVDFSLLNYGRFNSIASLITDSDEGSDNYGTVMLETGHGDLLVSAYRNGLYGEEHIRLEEASGEAPAEKTVRIASGTDWRGQWRELDFHAPGEVPVEEKKTEEQAAAEKARLEAAAESRRRRVEGFYDKEAADRVLTAFSGENRDALEEILRQARGNIGEIVRFLEWDFGGDTAELERLYGKAEWKLEALRTLRENDYWDVRAEALADCSRCAAPYAPDLPREVFFPWLLNPCVTYDRPLACRGTLQGALEEAQKERIRRNPGILPGIIEDLVVSLPGQEYANLLTSPVGCLTGGIGSEFSKEVLCVQIYRALGIPARMRAVDRTLEYYADGKFTAAALKQKKPVDKTGTVVLKEGENLKLEDWPHYSLSRFDEGRFQPLSLHQEIKKEESDMPEGGAGSRGKEAGKEPQKRSLQLILARGIYRLVTTNRLPNGNQLVKIYDFGLEENGTEEIELSMRGIPAEAGQEKKPVEDMVLYTEEGMETLLSVQAGQGRSLFLWLELAKEPTEHILNEICEKKEMFRRLETKIFFIVRKGSGHESDGTLAKARKALPGARVLLDNFGEAYEEHSHQVGKAAGKLPLAVVLEAGTECVYSDAGYNVGMADMLLQILS